MTSTKKKSATRKKSPKVGRRGQHQINRFADEVISGKGPTQAALAISPKLKPGSAKNKGRRMMTDPRVQERIRERFNDGASLTAQEVVGTLASHLRVDAADFVEILNPGLAEEMREKKVGHLIQEIEIREEKIAYGDTKSKVQRLAKEMEEGGAKLTDQARATLLAAAAPVSRTIRVRFHSSSQAASKLTRLMGLEYDAHDRDKESKIRARVLAACKKLAQKFGKELDDVVEEYLKTVPEHAKYFDL